MAMHRLRIEVADRFDLRLVLFSHGWIDLAPHGFDEATRVFTTVMDCGASAVDVRIGPASGDGAITATVNGSRKLSRQQLKQLRARLVRMLRLDADLEEFWRLCAAEPRLAWVARRGAGRIFCSASVFEDLMKLLFTTNCSWAATKLMTSRLVEALGRRAPSGRRSFPDAASCASVDEAFYRDTVRAGYRAKSCLALARSFADGEVDEAWFSDGGLPLETLRERLLAVAGFGPYAAGQAMRTLGHYKDLALDSWCRSRLATMAGRERPPSDATVAKRYRRFDPFDGLALWMDLTAEWHGESAR